MSSETPPRGFFRCPHCRQKTITAWTKLRMRAVCPGCGQRFVAGSWGLLLASLVMPAGIVAPLFVFHPLWLPPLWLFLAVGGVLAVALAGVTYLFTTPLYRKGSVAARWDAIAFFTFLAAVLIYAIMNTEFNREAGLASEGFGIIRVGTPVFSRDKSEGMDPDDPRQFPREAPGCGKDAAAEAGARGEKCG